jgi:PAS domain S-box-containing protein
MSQPLHILIIEDSKDDTELLLRQLRDNGYDLNYEQVETTEAMKTALARQSWDVVIADYSLPHFSAPAALSLLKEEGLDLPFIIVSGTIDEEVAVAAMKAGAHDYLVKGKLARLIPAIERELREAEMRRERRQAEEVLRQSKERYRLLVELSPDAIVLTDQNLNILLCNQQAIRMHQYDNIEEVIGRNALEFLVPEDHQRVRANMHKVLDRGSLKNIECTLLKKDGASYLGELSASVLVDATGRPEGFITIIRDITEHKRTKIEIQRRNRELTLLNQIIAASVANPEPEIVLETACRELALAFDLPQITAALFNEKKTETVIAVTYPPEDPKESLIENHSTPLHPTFRVTDSPILRHLFTYKAPLVIADAPHDPRLAQFRDLLDQRGIISILILPLIIEDEVIGSLTLEATQPRRFPVDEVSLAWRVADQVASALARIRLIQTSQRLSAAIEQVAESVVITDTNGTILYVNPAFERISGYGRAEVMGQNPRLLKSGRQDKAFYEDLWATITAGQVWYGRLINQRKDGSLYTEDAAIAPVRNEIGTVVNYVGVKRDVTHELELEERYRQAQKMEAIGRLSGGIAHDFNNLLFVINGYSELLLERHFDMPGPWRNYLEEIKKAGDRAARLTQQLLIFSRKQTLQPEVLNLNKVVTDVEKMLRRLIGEDIELVTCLDQELGQVKADPGQLEQVILNLAVNARDAMPHGGKLTIETANVELDETHTRQHLKLRPGPYIRLALSDTGVGMDQQTLERIFEPFFTTKEHGKGTGLGLATVYGIVKQTGGDIWAYSELGHGTTFKIYLPRADEPIPTSEPPSSFFDLPRGQETILLVEDEEAVRALTREILEMSGYTVLEAGHGGEALLLCEQHQNPLDLLMTDVVMPQMSGRTLAERMKALYPELKVLYISGYTDEAIVHHGVLGPGLFFLQKPFTPNSLASKVREVLDASTATCDIPH